MLLVSEESHKYQQSQLGSLISKSIHWYFTFDPQ